jgi:hypothetical protein
MEVASNPDGALGVDHIVALGDASASLGLISTLVFTLAVQSLLDFEFTSTAANRLVVGCLVCSCASSVFVTSFALLEYYYAQMIKAKDDEFRCDAIDGGDADRRLVREVADRGMDAVTHLRAHSRNGMWASLILLLVACVARVVEDEEPQLAGFCLLVTAGAIGAVLNNVRAFRAEFQRSTWRNIASRR